MEDATLRPAETLAAASSTLPPAPSQAPLGTTAEHVGGMTTKGAAPDSGVPIADEKREKHVLAADDPPSLPKIDDEQPTVAFPVRQLSNARLVAIASVATFTMILSAMGNSALNIALPTIQVELNMKETDLQWISSAYSLTFGCFLLLSGRLADIHGRKLVFLCGVTWYGIWTLVGPFFPNGAGLVVSRALSGCGAALTTPSAIGLIAANFHGRARATAFAAFAAGAPIGGGLGLTLGGVLTTYAPTTWKACMWVMAGMSVIAGVSAYFTFPTDILTTVDKRVDWVGAALVTVGLIFIQFSVSAGEAAPQGWATGYIIALLILGVILVGCFFFWENHVTQKTSRPPLMSPALWTRAHGRLAAVYMIGFVSWMGFVSIYFHSTLFYQQVQMLSPIQAMLRFLPMTVSGILCNILVAYVIARIPTQILVCIGILATGIAAVLFAVAPANVSYWRLPFHGMWMCVLGADFLMATGTLFISHLALPGEQSVAGALFQTLVQLGGSFGLALTTVISTSYRNRALGNGMDAVAAQLEGLHAAFWLAAGCSFSAFIVALIALRGMGTIGKNKKEVQETISLPVRLEAGERV